MTGAEDVPAPGARVAVAALLQEKEAGYLAEYAALVDAAYAVAARTGTVEPRVADIVAESGLSNQAFYRHFRSKDALLLAVVEDGRHRLLGYLEHRTAPVADPLDAVAEWIRGVLAQAQDAAATARTRPFVVHADRLAATFPAAQQESVQRLRDLLARLVGAAVVAGHLPPRADSDQRVELVFWSAFDALKRALVAGRSPTDDDVDELVAFCLGGLGTPTTR